jgi:signal recognition particle subunit SRP19
MVSRSDKRWVIWPCYFDVSRSRSEGRRVAKRIAIKEPTIDLVEKAARALRFNPTVEQAARYPAKPWKRCGRVLIEKTQKKENSIKQIAERMHSKSSNP